MPNFDGCGFCHQPLLRETSLALLVGAATPTNSFFIAFLHLNVLLHRSSRRSSIAAIEKSYSVSHGFLLPATTERIVLGRAERERERENWLNGKESSSSSVVGGGNAAATAIAEKCRWPFSYINRQAATTTKTGRLNEPSNCRSKPQILNRKPRISCLCPEFAMKSLSWSPSLLTFLAIGLGKQGAFTNGHGSNELATGCLILCVASEALFFATSSASAFCTHPPPHWVVAQTFIY